MGHGRRWQSSTKPDWLDPSAYQIFLYDIWKISRRCLMWSLLWIKSNGTRNLTATNSLNTAPTTILCCKLTLHSAALGALPCVTIQPSLLLLPNSASRHLKFYSAGQLRKTFRSSPKPAPGCTSKRTSAWTSQSPMKICKRWMAWSKKSERTGTQMMSCKYFMISDMARLKNWPLYLNTPNVNSAMCSREG